MFVQSNDLFYAPNGQGIALFDDQGNPIDADVSQYLSLWDAGTEVDEEPGTGPNQAPRQNGPTGKDENGKVVLEDPRPSTNNRVIRVIIKPASAHNTPLVYKNFPLSGDQEVHDVYTKATGSANAALIDDTLIVSGSFNDLQGDLLSIAGSPSHIHQAPVGQNGPVVVLFDVESKDKRNGVLTAAERVSYEVAEAYRNNKLYINIHTEAFNMGALRGQPI